MMISPEVFYETQLKGKDDAELISIMKKLNSEINRLKDRMENPEPVSIEKAREIITSPDEMVRIKYNRMCIQKIKDGLLTKCNNTESDNFQNKINDIETILFKSGGYISGYAQVIVSFEADKVIIKREALNSNDGEKDYKIIHELNKKEFLKEFKELYVGEWRYDYSPADYGYRINGGNQWRLTVTYKDGTKHTSIGDNVYPYNFDELMDLLCIEEY